MLGLTPGELGLVTFIVVAIVSARAWPRMGEWVARKVTGSADAPEDRASEKRS